MGFPCAPTFGSKVRRGPGWRLIKVRFNLVGVLAWTGRAPGTHARCPHPSATDSGSGPGRHPPAPCRARCYSTRRCSCSSPRTRHNPPAAHSGRPRDSNPHSRTGRWYLARDSRRDRGSHRSNNNDPHCSPPPMGSTARHWRSSSPACDRRSVAGGRLRSGSATTHNTGSGRHSSHLRRGSTG